MIVINEWMESLLGKLKVAFGERLMFVGLQGSYQRDEATENSDIDAVIILDNLIMEDLEQYKAILSTMPDNEKACGFISGRKEMQDWPRHEIFQFSNDTRPYYGNLDGLIPAIERIDIIKGVKIGASNLYHFCCQSYLYGETLALKEIYKGAFFVLQGAYYLRNNIYIKNKQELMPLLDGEEKQILTISNDWDAFEDTIKLCPYEYYKTLLQWCSGIITEEF